MLVTNELRMLSRYWNEKLMNMLPCITNTSTAAATGLLNVYSSMRNTNTIVSTLMSTESLL